MKQVYCSLRGPREKLRARSSGSAARGRRSAGPSGLLFHAPTEQTPSQEMPVSRYSRWNELLELLAADGQLQVERAAQVLGVSAATVRRDFDELARQQMLTRIRGGAVAKGVTYDLPLRYKTERHPSEKQRIAAAAAGLVLPGQIVGLNGGTTTTEVARALAVRADLNSG